MPKPVKKVVKSKSPKKGPTDVEVLEAWIERHAHKGVKGSFCLAAMNADGEKEDKIAEGFLYNGDTLGIHHVKGKSWKVSHVPTGLSCLGGSAGFRKRTDAERYVFAVCSLMDWAAVQTDSSGLTELGAICLKLRDYCLGKASEAKIAGAADYVRRMKDA